MMRKDNWTVEDDQILAEVTLRQIREGGTQLKAFDEAGERLNRTAAACGFRWNSYLRKQYVEEIKEAKRIRKSNKSTETSKTIKHPNLKMDEVIHFLKHEKRKTQEINQLKKELESKKKEMEELKQRYEALQREHQQVKEDYTTLVRIMDRARKMAFLEDESHHSEPNKNMEQTG